MAQKPGTEQFTQNWNKTVNWAKQNNIPYSAYYPVYQLDAQRFVSSGTPYSETDRIKAIEASAGLNYSNALPTDNPNWTHLRSNTIKNAESIFTGLEPTHLVTNVLSTIGNIFSHPSSVLSPIGDLLTGNDAAASRKVLEPHNIWGWVPGAYDLATVFAADPHLTGSKGAQALAKDPISAVLDVLPFGRAGSEALGRTAAGAKIADKIGMSTEELRKAGIWRVGGKSIKATPVPTRFTREEHPWLQNMGKNPTTGLATPTLKEVPTIGDFWQTFRIKIGAGSEAADVAESRLRENLDGTAEVARMAAPAMTVLSTLTAPQREALHVWARTETRPLESVMADNKVPQVLRNAYYAAYQLSHTLEETKMQAGQAVKIKQPFNDVGADGKVIHNPDKPDLYETYYVDTTAHSKVSSALDQAQADATARDEVMKPIAAILFKIDENDRNLSGVFDAIAQAQSNVYDSIKRSIPESSDAVGEQLRSTLPQEVRWDRAVAEQTPLIRNLLGLPPALDAATRRLHPDIPEKNLTPKMVKDVRDLFSPGGLIDKMVQAFHDEDWVLLNKLSKAAVRKFNNSTFKDIPKQGRATLHTIRRMTENTQKYAADRQRLAEEAKKRVEGKYRGHKMNKTAYGKSLVALTEKAAKSQDKWLQTAIRFPPDVWRNVGVDQVATKLAQEEKTAAAIEKTGKILSRQGWEDSSLTKMMQNPRTMQELMTNDSKASLENAMLPDVDHQESITVTKDMYENLASLRARGHQPLHVQMLTPGQLKNFEATYNVYIRGVKPKKIGSNQDAIWGYTPTVYDIGAGLLQETKDIVEHDMMQRFIDQELMPRLYETDEIQKLAVNYFSEDIAHASGDAHENALTALTRALDHWNLKEFDPKALFGGSFSHPTLNKPYLISNDLADAFSQTINKFQFPAQSIVDRGTKLFRFSILSLSPRYTAHILLGGSFLVGLRAGPSILKWMGPAISYAYHGSFSEKTLQKFPDEMKPMLDKAALHLKGEAPNEGIAAAQYQYARGAMHSLSTHALIPEKLQTLGLSDNYQNRLVAMANLNTTFTRAVTTAQRAAVYLDGASKALKSGNSFYEDKLIPRTPTTEGGAVDAEGRPVTHSITGRTIHDSVRQKTPMTPEQAHKLGMEATAETMGNLRHMTPLERSVLTRVFPFYGWTKHILQYVMSYPFDHPWRAMILSQIAMQNSQDIASGLPLRIQLLTMLGKPDQFGNVTAIDTKSLDPLRDTANYASWVGLFESLNPAITAPIGLVDPQISFAGQSIYPQVTFNSLYGTSTAGAGGNLATAAEQFVPQLTALDTAFNISGQYAYLSKNNPQAFYHKIFESIGLPFTPEQLNLRQMAAKAELARFHQADAAAIAASKGDTSALAGYDPNTAVPDPLNSMYNVTPAYIAAMEQQSEDTTGLPYYETATPPRSPPL